MWSHSKQLFYKVTGGIQNNQGLGKGYQPQPVTPTSTLVILDTTKTESNNCFIVHLTKQTRKSCFCFFTDGKQHSCARTWHDYPWSWVALTWFLYNLQLDDVQGANFKNSLYAFSQSEKSSRVECMIIISLLLTCFKQGIIEIRHSTKMNKRTFFLSITKTSKFCIIV